jgi:hypothetical protein
MHRLAWLYMTTAWAKEDHVNGVKDDNRFANLREVTRQQNSATSVPTDAVNHATNPSAMPF